MGDQRQRGGGSPPGMVPPPAGGYQSPQQATIQLPVASTPQMTEELPVAPPPGSGWPPSNSPQWPTSAQTQAPWPPQNTSGQDPQTQGNWPPQTDVGQDPHAAWQQEQAQAAWQQQQAQANWEYQQALAAWQQQQAAWEQQQQAYLQQQGGWAPPSQEGTQRLNAGWAEVSGRLSDMYDHTVVVEQGEKLHPLPSENTQAWILTARAALLADPVGFVLMQGIVLMVTLCTAGVLFGPSMMAWTRYMERRQLGQKVALGDLFASGEIFQLSMVSGLIIFWGLALFLSAGSVVGFILGTIPYLGYVLGPAAGLAVLTLAATVAPLLFMVFPLLLRRPMQVADLFKNIWKVVSLDPQRAATFGFTVGLYLGGGFLLFGLGILVTGPIAMWTLTAAAWQVFEL